MTGGNPFRPNHEGMSMSFHTSAHSPGVFVPSELAMLQALVDEMRGESWYPRSPAIQEKFAAFVLKAYDRGITCPAKLKAYCALAARMHFREPVSSD
jgi:hypothetical protein